MKLSAIIKIKENTYNFIVSIEGKDPEIPDNEKTSEFISSFFQKDGSFKIEDITRDSVTLLQAVDIVQVFTSNLEAVQKIASVNNIVFEA